MIRLVYAAALLICVSVLGIEAPAKAASPAVPRLALVIGEGAYTNAPQAAKTTAVEDAGLISFQLQQAGFDVTGGGDVDRQGFETLAATFIAKLGQAGPNAVAVIYVSGLGLQMDGDNRIIPVDARLAAPGAVATETISLGELLAQFQSMPAAARIAIFDLSRPLPFPIAKQVAPGLAAMNPTEGFLVAFSQQPGYLTQEPAGQTYGPYASALAEAIRVPGIQMDELFGRVRLRVQQDTKGGQLPWNVSDLTSDFTFFQPEAGAPPPARSYRTRPIRGLPMADAFALAIERDTIDGYREFVAAYPGTPLARRAQAIIAARREAFYWQRTAADGSPRAYWTYLRHYSRGPHAQEARERLEALRQSFNPPAGFADEDYDIPPPPPDEDGYYVPYDQWYEQPPPPAPPLLFLPAPAYVFEGMGPGRRERPGFLPLPANPVPLPARIIPVPVPVRIAVPARVAPLPLAVPVRHKPPAAGGKTPRSGGGAGQFTPIGAPTGAPPTGGPKPTGNEPPKVGAPGTPLPMPNGPAVPGAKPVAPKGPGTPLGGKPGDTGVKPEAPKTPGTDPLKEAPTTGTPLPTPKGRGGPGAPKGPSLKPDTPKTPGAAPGIKPQTPKEPGAVPSGKPEKHRGGPKGGPTPTGAVPEKLAPPKPEPKLVPKAGPKPDVPRVAPTPKPEPKVAPTIKPVAPDTKPKTPVVNPELKPAPHSGGGPKAPCTPAEHAAGKC